MKQNTGWKGHDWMKQNTGQSGTGSHRSRWIAGAAAVFLTASLSACGGTGAVADEMAADPNHYVIGDFALDYKGAKIMTDSYEKDAVAMTLDFTNNSKEAASYLWSISESAFQDGVELEPAFIFLSPDSFDMMDDSQGTEVEPGKTLEVNVCFELRDLEHEVKVSFEEMIGDQKAELTLDPASLERDTSNLGSTESEAASDTAEDGTASSETAEREVSSDSAGSDAEPASGEAAGTAVSAEIPEYYPFAYKHTSEVGKGEYGHSNAEATGLVSHETLKSFYDTFTALPGSDQVSHTYEDFRDAMGTDGFPKTCEEETWWKDTFHTYTWYDENGVFISAYFNVKDGEETYAGMTYDEDGLKN